MSVEFANEEKLKDFIVCELPKVMEKDPVFQRVILKLTTGIFADKQETESRFDKLLEELRRDREAQEKKWEAQDEKMKDMIESVKLLAQKHESTIGALGARWGLHTEQSFRNALKDILESHFDVQVLNITEFDEKGEIFDRPDQVELDIIIKNGILIICEIKSSMSKADMAIFNKKIEFYKKRHDIKVDQAIVISPMVDEKARSLASKFGIKIYSYVQDLKEESFVSPISVI